MISFVLVLILMSSVSGILGPVCPGNTVTLTCDGTNRKAPAVNFLNLAYDGSSLLSIIPGPITLPDDTQASDDGTVFTVSLLPTSPDFIQIQISFVASGRNNGKTLECSINGVGDSVTFQVENVIGTPSDVRQSNSTPGIEQSTVTIEWTPPPNGGNIMYTIATTPAPLSGAMPVTTNSTHITITVHYNIPYTITVAVNTTCEASANILIAGCVRPPAPDNGVLLPFLTTNEGAEILYHCGPGFQPQSNITSMCGSNALWTPDPALHNCTVDCGDPVLPSDVGVSAVSGTTEGAIACFQCEEGLLPSHPICITCTSTGQWMPNPQNTQCSSEATTDRVSTDRVSTDVVCTDVASSSLATTTDVGTASTTTDSLVSVLAVCCVLLFLVGLVCGFAAGALVVYCCARNHHRKPHPPPLPAPLYEEVVTSGGQQQLKLQDNTAYGHFK